MYPYRAVFPTHISEWVFPILESHKIVFSYRKYENVTIGDNQELTENTPSVPMEITDDTLPVDNGAFGQTEENTVPSAKSEQETE